MDPAGVSLCVLSVFPCDPRHDKAQADQHERRDDIQNQLEPVLRVNSQDAGEGCDEEAQPPISIPGTRFLTNWYSAVNLSPSRFRAIYAANTQR